MGRKRLDQISDYTRHGYALQVRCRACKHVAIVNLLRITMLCQERGWSRDMGSVAARLRCDGCKAKDVVVGPVER